ncbi:CBO0543 family protein [Cytobacillus sp. FJAT-53684]|uniref:CBO0543 family protein n=1 Tax=Cytobacillus mangrovibacter TaxID=3299024 RepID=A0ABW6JSQ2_9BACI
MERLKMTIAKHLKDSSLQSSRKKLFPLGIKKVLDFLPVILLSSLYGTYLDLYFVGKGMYSFPVRPLPEIFTINLAFTLIGLPLMTLLFLSICNKMKNWKIVVFILVLSLIMAVFEKQAEVLGFFVHHHSWKHLYSLFGYSLYLTIILLFDRFIRRIKK